MGLPNELAGVSLKPAVGIPGGTSTMRIVVLVGVFLLHLTSLACAITGRAEGAPNPTASSARATTVDVVRTAFRHVSGTAPTEGSLTGGLTANAFAAHGGGGGGGHACGFGRRHAARTSAAGRPRRSIRPSSPPSRQQQIRKAGGNSVVGDATRQGPQGALEGVPGTFHGNRIAIIVSLPLSSYGIIRNLASSSGRRTLIRWDAGAELRSSRQCCPRFWTFLLSLYARARLNGNLELSRRINIVRHSRRAEITTLHEVSWMRPRVDHPESTFIGMTGGLARLPHSRG
jgi:hypothetical protein